MDLLPEMPGIEREHLSDVSDRTRDTASPQRPGPRRAGLGRGLEALIPSLESTPALSVSSVSTASIANISPNPRQPRSTIDPDELQVLADSIRTHGIIQPIVVKPDDAPDRYRSDRGRTPLARREARGAG